MTKERENYLTGLIAIVMSGAFFPTLCVISDEPQRGELKYFGEESYDNQTTDPELSEPEMVQDGATAQTQEA
jgi:hypothetical protein